MYHGHLFSRNTSELTVSMNGPKSLVLPTEWCDKERGNTHCICEYQHDVQIIDIGDVGEFEASNSTFATADDNLAATVDWWTEGVVLPIICGVGIIGDIISCKHLYKFAIFRKHVFHPRPHKQKD